MPVLWALAAAVILLCRAVLHTLQQANGEPAVQKGACMTKRVEIFRFIRPCFTENSYTVITVTVQQQVQYMLNIKNI